MAGTIALWARRCSSGNSFIVRFPDQDAAIRWAQERKSTHVVTELKDEPVPDECGSLLDYLYPKCDHGLSASLCADPVNHYPPDNASW